MRRRQSKNSAGECQETAAQNRRILPKKTWQIEGGGEEYGWRFLERLLDRLCAQLASERLQHGVLPVDRGGTVCVIR